MTQVLPEVNFYRENTLLENTPPPALTTEDIVVRGIDKIDEAYNEKTYEALLADGIQAELKTLDAWMAFKVKNELMTQIFSGIGVDNWQIDIGAIHAIVSQAMTSEKDRHFQDSVRIENQVIPLAMTRSEFKNDDPTYYWYKDVDNLYTRAAIHLEISERIAQIEATGEDGMYDLSDKYIQRMILLAHQEALAIKTKQVQELEAQGQQRIAKIGELEGVIDALVTQLEQLEHFQEQVEDREEQPRDRRMTLFTTLEDIRLAA